MAIFIFHSYNLDQCAESWLEVIESRDWQMLKTLNLVIQN